MFSTAIFNKKLTELENKYKLEQMCSNIIWTEFLVEKIIKIEKHKSIFKWRGLYSSDQCRNEHNFSTCQKKFKQLSIVQCYLRPFLKIKFILQQMKELTRRIHIIQIWWQCGRCAEVITKRQIIYWLACELFLFAFIFPSETGYYSGRFVSVGRNVNICIPINK